MFKFDQSIDEIMVQNSGKINILGAFKEYAVIELDVVHKPYADRNNFSLARALCYKCLDDTDILYHNCSDFLCRTQTLKFPVTFLYTLCVGGVSDTLSSEGIIKDPAADYYIIFEKKVQNTKEFNEQLNKHTQRFQFVVPYVPSDTELNDKKDLIYLDKDKTLKLHTYPTKNRRPVYDVWGEAIKPSVVSIYRLNK